MTDNVLVITSSVPSFRRAGEGFTDKGVAFPIDYFDEEKLEVLRREKKISVQEMASDQVPEDVDMSRLSAPDSEVSTNAKKPPAKAAAKATGTANKASD